MPTSACGHDGKTEGAFAFPQETTKTQTKCVK